MSPSPDTIREFVIAGHGDLNKVQTMLAAQPELLNEAHDWGAGDLETAVMAAAHMGHRPLAEFLLDKGAPLQLCTAAMLGRTAVVQEFLAADPNHINGVGAHGIPLLTHAALSGDTALVQLLVERGAQTGISMGLSMAVSGRDTNMVRWLLAHTQPDLNWQNFQGKTALEIATESEQTELVELLKQYQNKATS